MGTLKVTGSGMVMAVVVVAVYSIPRFVLKLEATDEDRGLNGRVQYSIVRLPGQAEAEFVIDSENGDVFVTEASGGGRGCRFVYHSKLAPVGSG